MKTNIYNQLKETMTANEEINRAFLIYIPDKGTLTIDYNFHTKGLPSETFKCTLEEFVICLTFVNNDPFFDGRVTVEYGGYR